MKTNPRILWAGLLCLAVAACVEIAGHEPPSQAVPTSAAPAAAPATSPQPARAAASATPAPAVQVLPPAGTAPAKPPATMTADGYHLVWHDEFDKDGPLNPADWGYENGFVRNQEAQFYQPDNAICKDGFLIIEARKESKPNPRYNGPRPGIASPGPTPATTPTTAPTTTPTATAPARGRGRGAGRGATSNNWPNLPTIDITAASVNTRGKHEWTYGRFEIRAKIDTRSGSWPAFWTLGTQGGWPGNGEIDIMEYYRNMVLANIAWQGPNGAIWNSVRNQLNTFPRDFSSTFHTWRMDWDEKAIDLYLDDKRVNHQDLSATVNTGGRGTGTNPFINKPVYLMLNQAIGGQNGGDYSQTQFPILFYVDYVRVWQKDAKP